MNTSVRWLNRYLNAPDVSPDEAVAVLEATSFPIEDRTDLPSGDTLLDVEITSNRGDCVSHLGLARELAAATGRGLTPPAPPAHPAGDAVHALTSVENRVPSVCPRFTARLIRGVSVGPSPDWLTEALEAVGLRPINNIVDISNFVLLELGHPNHVFDFDTLEGRRLVVRHAAAGEKLTTLEDQPIALDPTDLVVADGARPVSLAGVIGGRDSGVTENTTNVLLEVATWDPATIRRTARRLDIRTDAGYRFERIVDPRELTAAADRCLELILELAGGDVVEGTIDVGAELQAPRDIDLRLARTEHVLGMAVPTDEIVTKLTAIGFRVQPAGAGVLRCVVPNYRPDITREIDVIEEVARLHGIDNFAISPTIQVPLDLDHPPRWEQRDRATRLIRQTIAAAGFYETVTFSFLREADAPMFLEKGHRSLRVDEERRKDTPYLRPSLVPSLLHCRRANQDARAIIDGGVRLFEIASVFDELDDGDAHGRKTRERRALTLLLDAGTKHDDHQLALRTLRGAIDSVARELGGAGATVETVPANDPPCPALAKATNARCLLRGDDIGHLSLLTKPCLAPWSLDEAVAVAELRLEPLLALYPPKLGEIGLPDFPAIDRDVSLILAESTPWASVASLVEGLDLERLERLAFVASFRGKQIGAGKKSMTLRLTFRSPDRTLRHEEVDPQIEILVAAASKSLDAEIRT